MTIKELTAILPPPANPAENVGNWTIVERQLGTKIPSDYKDFIRLYGTGCIDDFLWVLNPFTINSNLEFFERGANALKALLELKQSFESEVPYALFPSTGGILPWGITDNGDVFYWLTHGIPDDWTTVLNAGRDARTEHFDCNLTSLLSGILSGQIASSILPSDFPAPMHNFRVVLPRPAVVPRPTVR